MLCTNKMVVFNMRCWRVEGRSCGRIILAVSVVDPPLVSPRLVRPVKLAPRIPVDGATYSYTHIYSAVYLVPGYHTYQFFHGGMSTCISEAFLFLAKKRTPPLPQQHTYPRCRRRSPSVRGCQRVVCFSSTLKHGYPIWRCRACAL